MINTIWFLCLLASGGFVVTADNSEYVYPFLILAILFSAFRRGRLLIPISSLHHYLLLFFLLLTLEILRYRDVISSELPPILIKLTIGLLVIGYLRTFDKTYIYETYSKFAEHVIYFSIIIFIIANLSPTLLFTYHHNPDYGGAHQTWFWLGYFRAGDFEKYGFLRNQAFFWEPGVFGVYIITAYIVKRFALSDNSNTKTYLVGIASTMSMGSILIMLAAMAIAYQFSSTSRYKLVISTLAYFFITLGSLLVFAVEHSGTDIFAIISKLVFQRDITDDSSIFIRFADLALGFQAALGAIWIGHGRDYSEFYSLSSIVLDSSKESYDGGITNSIVAMLYKYGIVFTASYIIILYSFAKRICNDRRQAVGILLIFLACLMLEPLYFSLLFFIFLLFPFDRKVIALTLRSQH